MKNNRFEITALIILLVISIIVFLGYNLFDVLVFKNRFTLITSPFTVIKCKKNICTTEEHYQKYLNKRYYAYINGEIISNRKIEFDKTNKVVTIKDKEDNKYSSRDTRLLLSNKKDIVVKDIRLEDITKENNNDLNLKYSEKISYIFSINDDFDNDGYFDNIYFIKSQGQGSFYGALIYSSNGTTEILDDSVANSEYALYTFNVRNVIDVDNDGILELIVSKTGYDGMNYCTQIYKLIDGDYVPLNECKMVNN